MANLELPSLPKIIVVCGPTATGKSDLAVDIALHIGNAEIISTDSRQIFKYLHIGTGKITEKEMRGIPHHMIDIIEPMDEYSVFAFAEKAKHIIEDIYNRGNTPILCGGTGQYIDAIISGTIGAPVPPNPLLREKLERLTFEEVFAYLQKLSREKKCNISNVDIKNKRRIIRAIEIIEKIGFFPEKNITRTYNAIHIGLDTDNEKLRARIKQRLDARIDSGMIQESKDLLGKGLLTHDRMYKLGLEYRYISLLLQNKINEQEFKDQLFFAIWHYAKRQRTWFKRNADIHWFDAIVIKEDKTKVFKLL